MTFSFECQRFAVRNGGGGAVAFASWGVGPRAGASRGEAGTSNISMAIIDRKPGHAARPDRGGSASTIPGCHFV